MVDKHLTWILGFWARELLYSRTLHALSIAKQFGYDQFYVGNPNPNLRFYGNLFEGTRAWYYRIAGGSGVVFALSHKTSNSYASFDFYTWYFMASKVPGFGVNTSCVKGIKSVYKAK